MSNNIKQTIARFCSKAKVAVLGGALLVAGSTVAFTHIANAKDSPKNPPVHLSVDDAPVKPNGGYQTTFAPVVKKVSPGVVKISVSSKATPVQMEELGENNELLRRFFGDQFNQQQRRQRSPKQEGLGSGVIVSKDGYILTNNHVVDHADQIKVELNDGREFTGRVIGADAKSDIAVVKIDATDLPYVMLANSDKIEVGDLVLAVGNPFGIGQTVTMGMVSATGRAHMGLDYEDFIQTDAAINPGNSGGALVDAEGRLVGINTAIISRSGGNQGIGFAVPVNLARYVMESIVQNG
ncbi:MAG: Protease Do, partial [Verrucomicrobiales bacterium]|nr:Protease Do [Verrucomicrobiales bacterium]